MQHALHDARVQQRVEGAEQATGGRQQPAADGLQDNSAISPGSSSSKRKQRDDFDSIEPAAFFSSTPSKVLHTTTGGMHGSHGRLSSGTILLPRPDDEAEASAVSALPMWSLAAWSEADVQAVTQQLCSVSSGFGRYGLRWAHPAALAMWLHCSLHHVQQLSAHTAQAVVFAARDRQSADRVRGAVEAAGLSSEQRAMDDARGRRDWTAPHVAVLWSVLRVAGRMAMREVQSFLAMRGRPPPMDDDAPLPQPANPAMQWVQKQLERSLVNTTGVSAAMRLQLLSDCELVWYWLDNAVRASVEERRPLSPVHLLEQARLLMQHEAWLRTEGEVGRDEEGVSLMTSYALPDTVPMCVWLPHFSAQRAAERRANEWSWYHSVVEPAHSVSSAVTTALLCSVPACVERWLSGEWASGDPFYYQRYHIRPVAFHGVHTGNEQWVSFDIVDAAGVEWPMMMRYRPERSENERADLARDDDEDEAGQDGCDGAVWLRSDMTLLALIETGPRRDFSLPGSSLTVREACEGQQGPLATYAPHGAVSQQAAAGSFMSDVAAARIDYWGHNEEPVDSEARRWRCQRQFDPRLLEVEQLCTVAALLALVDDNVHAERQPALWAANMPLDVRCQFTAAAMARTEEGRMACTRLPADCVRLVEQYACSSFEPPFTAYQHCLDSRGLLPLHSQELCDATPLGMRLSQCE